jgi:hypothetical protein
MPDPTPTPKGDIKLPGLGKVDKKYAIGGGLAAIAIVVVVIIRKKSAANAAAAATPATGTTDTTASTDPTIDPATGVPYADELGSQYGSGLGDLSGYGGTGSSAVSGDYDAAGYPIGSEADLQWQQAQSGTTPITGLSTGAVTTNSAWLQEAVSVLANQGGDTATIQTALTMVLGGLTVTSAQQSLFLEAVGTLGQPPQGYPQPIKLSNTAATSTGTTPGTNTHTAPATPTGLSTGQISATSARAHWTTVANSAGGKNLYVTQLKQAGKLIRTESTDGNFNSFTGLKPKTAYQWQVIAENSAGKSSWAGPIGFSTS